MAESLVSKNQVKGALNSVTDNFSLDSLSIKEQATELANLAEKLNFNKDQIKFISTAKFTKEDAEIMKLQLEIKEKNDQLSSDMEYLEKYLLPMKEEGEDKVSTLAQYPKDIKAQLEEINADMLAQIDANLKIEYVDALEVGLSVLVDTFTQALEPFLEVPNMPEIPLIGDLGNFLQTLDRMGKVERNIQKSLTADQKKKWKEAIEAQNKTEDGKEKSFMERMRDSAVGGVLKDIKDAIMAIVQMLPSLINFFWLALLNELIQLLKPVFDAFGIVAGTFMGLMESVPDLLTSSWKLAQTLGYKLLKIAYAKLENIFSIFYLIGDVQGTVDDQIKILEQDMLQCRYEIEEKNLEIKVLSEKNIQTKSEIELKRLNRQMKFPRNIYDEKILESAKETIERIKNEAEKNEENSTEVLEEFRTDGIEGFAKKIGKEDILPETSITP